MNLILHDSATGTNRPLETREPGTVSMYVCGPTVNGPPHLGHGRFVLVFDILRRYLTWSGLSVVYASNITDVDDKIIARAREEGRSEAEVALEFEAVWFDTMDRLGVQRPTHVPHATEYIPRMVTMVGELVDRGMAYETADGVYLAVELVADYGLLIRQPLSELRAGARVVVDEAKRSPLDFALWKKSPPGTDVTWPSPWGTGRPGWHTECVVMSLDLLGDGFDLHGGGIDLRFPHHENERAQAVALGRGFANHWMHNGFLEDPDGKKMGKSENNAMSLVDALDQYDPRAYRLLVLQSHYRSPMQVSPKTLSEADRTLVRLDGSLRRSVDLVEVQPDPEIMTEFRDRMNDDLDTPGVAAAVFGAIRRVNTVLDQGMDAAAAPILAAVTEILAVLGLGPVGRSTAENVPEPVARLVDARSVARDASNWACADDLRIKIESLGWTVRDTAAGQVVEPVDAG